MPPMAAGRLIGGRYRLDTPIASGAMGAVWRGTDERLHGRPCAIKGILLGGATAEERAERALWFTREAQVLSALRHPAICDIRDIVSEGGMQYLVLELIEGHTLADELAGRGAPGLPEAEVLAWAAVLCDALAYLHDQTPPVIFRDLKPQNIMLRQDGRLTLIDFGIARQLTAPGGTAIGTGGYAPAEQYQGLTEPRSDVYALGATLHHLLTGRDPTTQPPFTFPGARALVPTISPHVDAALAQALSLVIDKRFPSMRTFAAALAGKGATPAQAQPTPQSGTPPAAHAPLLGLDRLNTLLADARRTATPLPHLLLVDPLVPGAELRGVAQVLAAELGGWFSTVNAAGLLQASDLMRILTHANDGDILYIEDAGALRSAPRDVLRQALLYRTIDAFVGTGATRQVETRPVQRCTVIAGVAAKDLGSAVATFFDEKILVERLTADWKARIAALDAQMPPTPLPSPAASRGSASPTTPAPAATARTRRVVLVPPGTGGNAVERVKSRVIALLGSRFVHPPEGGGQASLSLIELSLEAWIDVRYTIDAVFHADGSVIHREKGSGRFALSGQSGQPLGADIDAYIRDHLSAVLAGPTMEDEDVEDDTGIRSVPLLSETEVRQAALQRVFAAHTCSVSYERPGDRPGRTQRYSRRCVPTEADVHLDATTIRALTIETMITLGDHTFSATWLAHEAPAGSLHLLHTDLPARLPLCQMCGGVDDREIACTVCGRFACSRCALNSKLFCSVECQDQLLQRRTDALNQIGDPELRERVARSGDLPLGVLVGGEGEIVLTRERAYIQGHPILELAKADVAVVYTQPAGRLLRRQWEVVVVAPRRRASWVVGCFEGESFAQALAHDLREWAQA